MEFYGSPLFVVLTVTQTRGPAGGKRTKHRVARRDARKTRGTTTGRNFTSDVFIRLTPRALRSVHRGERGERIPFAKTNRARFDFLTAAGSLSVYFARVNLPTAFSLFLSLFFVLFFLLSFLFFC